MYLGSHMLSGMLLILRLFCLQDILYRYPRLSEDEGGGVVGTQEKLVRLRGAFLTLSDVLATITASPSISK